jgi:hypothetical protein
MIAFAELNVCILIFSYVLLSALVAVGMTMLYTAILSLYRRRK